MPRHALWTISIIILLAPARLCAGGRPAASPYQAVDLNALRAPKESEASIETLAAYLTKPAKNDRQKVRAIFRWVTDRIAYDMEALFSNKEGASNPVEVLKARKARCGGYANLFLALCERAGIEAVFVRGTYKTSRFRKGEKGADHAWNAVKFENKWWLVDSTVGAGAVSGKDFNKHFDEFFFLTPPDQFIFHHFPAEPKWQLLPEPISEKEFLAQPVVSHWLFKMGISTAAIQKACQEPGDHELVKVFPLTSSQVRLRSVPLLKHLTPGAKYTFKIDSTFAAVGMINKGHLTKFPRRGTTFEGVITAPQGPITIVGLSQQPGKSGTFTAPVFLEYFGGEASGK